MAREHAFVQVDVFTDRPLTGNALAVILDGQGLTADEMQAIALEMNLAETTFILPPTRSDCAARVRIFTPGRELPFAGHPTLGTAWVLANRGLVSSGMRRFALEEGIGRVPVELDGERFVWMSQQAAVFGPELLGRPALARALGLEVGDLRPDAPAQPVSTGNSFVFVALRDRAAVDRASGLDLRALHSVPEVAASVGVFLFAIDDAEGHRLYSRMFGPQVGVPEDPATGSAAGPLGAYLVRHGLVKGSGELTLVNEQGTKMKRPSFVHIRLNAQGGEATHLRVGGSVVPVLDGRLRLP